ncbi:MAG: hypothetical protein ACREN6_02190 [Gemmatimonadaceae bacterium]
MPRHPIVLAALILAFAPPAVHAQILRDPGSVASAPTDVNSAVDVNVARRAQADFERFRLENLPSANSGRPTKCDEQVGNVCYWYNDKGPPPPREPPVIRQHEDQLIAILDTAAMHAPDDRWAVEQRVRYLAESARYDSAYAAAKECKVGGWWCDVLKGFSLHLLGRYAAADSVYSHALGQMLPSERCDWRNIDMLIDDDTRQQYHRFSCGDPKREAFENRAWFFARTLYSLDGNDSRTEHYARKTMEMMLRDAPGVTVTDSQEDDLELMLRFGWPRAWGVSVTGGYRSGGFTMGLPNPYGGRQTRVVREVTSYEPTPAYRYVPPGFVLNDPAMSDSSNWRLQLPPVIARYAPPYALSLTPLEHQKAMFRRGDTALVVLAYDARVTKQLAGGKLTAALVVTPSDKPTDYGKIVHDAPETGVLMAKAPWGPLLMSAEVYAPEKRAVARARYGVSPPFAVGTRVTLSDLLFYKPYGAFPTSLDQAAPHAVPTERLMANEKLGVYWEAYGTDPNGEKMKVSLTVVRDVEQHKGEATPVVVGVEDLSARGVTTSPRALELDISTLKKGSYIVELEIEVAGQYTVRAEHPIEIIGP